MKQLKTFSRNKFGSSIFFIFLLIFLLFIYANGAEEHGASPAQSASKSEAGTSEESSGSKEHESEDCEEHKTHIVLASWNWHTLGVYITITLFVLIAALALLVFHKLECLSSIFPESCLLIVLGIGLASIIYFTTDKNHPKEPCEDRFVFPEFTSVIFFNVLLPPSVLESAFSLHNQAFFDNLGSVLIFAVVGTLFNVFTIGLTLYGLKLGGLIQNMEMPIFNVLVFASLISSIDPVAVLAIFEELAVNHNLYFLVFGESLLNDGVTVVLYDTMKIFSKMNHIGVDQYFLAILEFFIVVFGGIGIGLVYGVVTAIFTKWTSHVRVIEPLVMLALAYLSYLTANLFEFSGIISLVVCGLIQAEYGFYNISHKSYVCVKYFVKMASSTADTVIFMFLGMVLVNDNWQWNTGFVIWTNVFCLIYRFLGVIILSALVNLNRKKPFTLEEQFIAAYGGLRGAVCFCLAISMDDDMEEKQIYVCTTLVVILFTVFVQGITMKPLVQLLQITRSKATHKKLIEEIFETSMDHTMAGIEEILGHHGDFYLKTLFIHYNEKYFKKLLLRDNSDSKLTRLFEKITLSEHIANLYGPIQMAEDHIKHLIAMNEKNIRKKAFISRTPQEDDRHFRQFSRQRRRQISAVSSISILPSYKTESRRTPHSAAVNRDDATFRNALRDNTYKRLYSKYNRNDDGIYEYTDRIGNDSKSDRKGDNKYSTRRENEYPDRRIDSKVPFRKGEKDYSKRGPSNDYPDRRESDYPDRRYDRKKEKDYWDRDKRHEKDSSDRRHDNFRRMVSAPSTYHRSKSAPDHDLPGQVNSPRNKGEWYM